MNREADVVIAEDKLALEHFRDPPHRVVADQDRRDERHVSPHKQPEEQSTGALDEIQPRGPVTFARPLIQSYPGKFHFSQARVLSFYVVSQSSALRGVRQGIDACGRATRGRPCAKSIGGRTR